MLSAQNIRRKSPISLWFVVVEMCKQNLSKKLRISYTYILIFSKITNVLEKKSINNNFFQNQNPQNFIHSLYTLNKISTRHHHMIYTSSTYIVELHVATYDMRL